MIAACGKSRESLYAPIPMTALGATGFWQFIEAGDRKRTHNPYWAIAVAAHLALTALFLATLTRPADQQVDSLEISMVAPPATPHAEPPPPPPPKPVQLKDIPKPQIIQPRATPKLIQKLDPQSPMAISVAPAPIIEAQKPPPPPEATAVAAPPQTYLSELYSHLARYKRYPRAAQLAHIEGTVLLRFTLNHQGQVLAYRIERGSRHADLDAEVLAMIERAQPLPAPPANMADPIELVIPVQFSVR